MRIAMLLSGGVDSSVALRLLTEAGHDVHAFYLKIWLEDELSYLGECPWEEDLRYARAVCDGAGVPLTVVPLQKEYWDRVISYVLQEVKEGRTPNPDVLCNARIKFGAFSDAVGEDFERIATGHYARTEESPEGGGRGVFLKRSADPLKDQTYFLSQLSQEQIARAMFPIGHLTKSEVRELAQKYSLPNADRKDSQGICFLGKIAFDQFLEHHLGRREGDILDAKTGKKIGVHPGFWYFTIGQRRNIGLSGGPWYVVRKDTVKNEVYVSNHFRSEDMYRDTFEVGDVHFLSAVPTNKNLSVKIRHGETEYPCRIEMKTGDRVSVSLLHDMDRGIAAGQFAVFYDGEYCLGGGVILEPNA